MSKSKPLINETVLFTGTPKSTDVLSLVKQLGGTPKSYPLIEVQELREASDEVRLKTCPQYDWLIFTSQSAVQAFHQKLLRYCIKSSSIPANIAAVGTKTARALERIGFKVQFIPTIFSADVFVEEFKPVKNDTRKLLFLKGNKAGSMIREQLPFQVDEWTIYETCFVESHTHSLIECIHQNQDVSVLFASPSAVEYFNRKIVPYIGWEGYTVCAIGHVTAQALLEAGATVHVQPTEYTLEALVKALAKRKEEDY